MSRTKQRPKILHSPSTHEIFYCLSNSPTYCKILLGEQPQSSFSNFLKWLIEINFYKDLESKITIKRLATEFKSDSAKVTKWINDIYKNEKRVEGAIYEGLTVDFCKKIKARFILRGIRYVSDFEYEKTIADANRTMDPTIETIFLTGEPKYTSVASTIVRDIIRNGGDASPFLPDVVTKSLIA